MAFVEHSKNVIRQALIVVTGFGAAGSAESSPRYAIHVAGMGDLRREVVKDVGRVAGTSE